MSAHEGLRAVRAAPAAWRVRTCTTLPLAPAQAPPARLRLEALRLELHRVELQRALGFLAVTDGRDAPHEVVVGDGVAAGGDLGELAEGVRIQPR
jgi:hypothetical protein